MTSCRIEKSTLFGNVGLEVHYAPRLNLRLSVATSPGVPLLARVNASKQTGPGTVEANFEIYPDAYIVEVQDGSSGALVQRALCVCVPGLRYRQPCRSASRTLLVPDDASTEIESPTLE